MKKNPLLWFLTIWVLQILLIFVWIFGTNRQAQKRDLEAKNQLVRRFLLTDYCLSTESRHTRHLSMPEWIAPFQDLPAFYEHFPSSSFFYPPTQPRK